MFEVDNGISARAVLGSVKNINRIKNCSFTLDRLQPQPYTPVTTTYLNQEFARTQISGKILNAVDPITKWRRPSGYRAFIGLIDLKPFDYRYSGDSNVRAPTTIYRRFGTTPTSYSVGVGPGMLFWGTKLSGGTYLPDVDGNIIHQAETECLAKLKEGSFNLAADLVEMPKTFDEIAKIAIRVAYAWKSTSIRDYKTAAKILFGNHGWYNTEKSAADQWLSWQYGWKPLLGDIYSAVELTKSSLRKGGSFCHAKRRVTQDYGFPPNPGSKSRWQTSGSCQVGCEVSLWAKVSSPQLAILDSLGLFNPFLLAWEELPFSFVIDWLAPIGTYLQAMSAPIGISFQGGTRVQRSRSDFDIECVIEPYIIGGALPSARIRNICMLRETYADFPQPMLYVKSPFTSIHTENAIALLANMR